ncbi:phosphate/phosphite/phosphonate ABC transporter substrate-binding protein [Baaleninema sp.]|uniref:phosphate/phosphite/phosphonate ABC transporter substrate-binding protein n=1 Tax=Baaleninema sp. TaxID=3101197 RepID=UPI003CFEE930
MKRRSFIGYALLLASGCTMASQTSSGIADNTDVLHFSVTDVKGLDPLEEDYEPFRAALENVLGRPVAFYPVETSTTAAAGLQSGDIEIALAGPTEYVVIRARTNAIPVIAITRPNYYSIGVVPAESPVKSIADLKGKTLAMSDLGSTSGHLGPTWMLVEAKLDPKTDYQVKFLGDEGSLEALQNREVDGWFGSLTDYEQFLERSQQSEDAFRVIVKSPPLPSDVLMVNSNTHPDFIETLREKALRHQEELTTALASRPGTVKYRGSELTAVSDGDYDSIREAYRAIGQGQFLK